MKAKEIKRGMRVQARLSRNYQIIGEVCQIMVTDTGIKFRLQMKYYTILTDYYLPNATIQTL